jgi:hypothetical protein
LTCIYIFYVRCMTVCCNIWFAKYTVISDQLYIDMLYTVYSYCMDASQQKAQLFQFFMIKSVHFLPFFFNILILLVVFIFLADYIHRGQRCTGCSKMPIVGLMWKCQSCFRSTLCTVCYMNRAHALSGHRFMRYGHLFPYG